MRRFKRCVILVVLLAVVSLIVPRSDDGLRRFMHGVAVLLHDQPIGGSFDGFERYRHQ